jgi:hypothetical protein
MMGIGGVETTGCSHNIRVDLPLHLRRLAALPDQRHDLILEVPVPVTIASILDTLELRFPMLRGAIRDHVTHQRRPFLRYFACAEDWSHRHVDTPLPEAVLTGQEPLIILGAIAGGC